MCLWRGIVLHSLLELAPGSLAYCELGATLAQPAANNIANTGINFFISSPIKICFKAHCSYCKYKALISLLASLTNMAGSYASTKITSPVIKPSTERSNALPTSLPGTG